MAGLPDFDKQFMRFAALRLKGKSEEELKDDALTRALNEITEIWLETKADWLDGMTPDEYFAAMKAETLIEQMCRYCAADMNVPEPLYRRISGDRECAVYLKGAVEDVSLCETARTVALRLLCDIGGEGTEDTCLKALECSGDMAEIACEWLKSAGYGAVECILKAYDSASEDVKGIMLDILCCYPGASGVAELLESRLLNDHEHRAMNAALAEKLGDPALIEPLTRLMRLSDISYYDYKEIYNAVEALGGDPGEERQFYGDPDYETLGNADTMPADL